MECVNEELQSLIEKINEEKENYKHYEILRVETAVKVEDTKNKIHKLELQIKELIGLGKLPTIRD